MTENLDCVERDGFLDSELFPNMGLVAFVKGVQIGLEKREYISNGYGAMPKEDKKRIYRFYVSKNGGSN